MRQGRPRELVRPTVTITCVIGADLSKLLDKFGSDKHWSQSEIIRAALYSYLDKSEQNEI